MKLESLPILNTEGSSVDKDNKAANAIDGKNDTKFSAKGKGEHLVIDLGKVELISRLSIKWYESDLRKQSYEISSSKDGKIFRRIGACISSGIAANEYEDHDFERPIEARYFKIVNQGNTLNSFISIIDVKVFKDIQIAEATPNVMTVGESAGPEVIPPIDPEKVKKEKSK